MWCIINPISSERRYSLLANKKTSSAVASKASAILRDNRYSKNSKSVAGSALSQTPAKKSK